MRIKRRHGTIPLWFQNFLEVFEALVWAIVCIKAMIVLCLTNKIVLVQQVRISQG